MGRFGEAEDECIEHLSVDVQWKVCMYRVYQSITATKYKGEIKISKVLRGVERVNVGL